jgi:hypothetical protein
MTPARVRVLFLRLRQQDVWSKIVSHFTTCYQPVLLGVEPHHGLTNRFKPNLLTSSFPSLSAARKVGMVTAQLDWTPLTCRRLLLKCDGTR